MNIINNTGRINIDPVILKIINNIPIANAKPKKLSKVKSKIGSISLPICIFFVGSQFFCDRHHKTYIYTNRLNKMCAHKANLRDLWD